MAGDKAPRKLKHKTIRPDLSLPEIRFCQIFIANNQNAAQAYRDSGFATVPASESALGIRVFRLLRKDKIREYIQELREDACEAEKVTVSSLAKSFKEQAHADRTLIFDDQGRMTNPRTWPKELRSIIAGIEVDNIEEWIVVDGERVKQVVGQNWKVKFERSTEAKKILAQWKGMIGNDKLEPPTNDRTIELEVLGRLSALLATRQPIASGINEAPGGPSGGGSVDSVSGTASPSVPQ